MNNTSDCWDAGGWAAKSTPAYVSASTFEAAATDYARGYLPPDWQGTVEVYVRDQHGEVRCYGMELSVVKVIKPASSRHVEGPLCAR